MNLVRRAGVATSVAWLKIHIWGLMSCNGGILHSVVGLLLMQESLKKEVVKLFLLDKILLAMFFPISNSCT